MVWSSACERACEQNQFSIPLLRCVSQTSKQCSNPVSGTQTISYSVVPYSVFPYSVIPCSGFHTHAQYASNTLGIRVSLFTGLDYWTGLLDSKFTHKISFPAQLQPPKAIVSPHASKAVPIIGALSCTVQPVYSGQPDYAMEFL